MSGREDEKLDAMLQSRRMEAASPNLAERIILKAQLMPQNPTISLPRRIKQLFAEFHLPRPAYVLTGALVLGFVVGLSTPGKHTQNSSEAPQAQSFLDTDEEVL